MARQADDNGRLRIPVIEEGLDLGRHEVETGRGIRLHKTVSAETVRIDDVLLRQELDIEHVPVDAWVEGEIPAQRHEGATLVVPVLEEVLVVQKRLRLKEEIRITARTRTEPLSESVTLRSEQVEVERFDEARPPPSPDRPP